MSNTDQQGIYINGKQQIIDMLRAMPEHEKETLLKNIRLKNAPVAKELSEQSLSFASLMRMPDESLRVIFETVNPAILGLALYPLSKEIQRKALSIINRTHAEKAFQIMGQRLESRSTEIRRAQDKVLQAAIGLSRRNMLRL